MTKNKRKILYEGKAKIIYEGPEVGTVIQHFKDDATAFNNQKKGTITGKGVLNNRISEFVFSRLSEMNFPTHFIKTLNMREQLVKKVNIIPIEVVVRNIAAGSICKRFAIQEGIVFPRPILEFYYKSDELGDPMINDDHIHTFSWADQIELEEIKMMAYRINDFLLGLFAGIGIRLVDFKLEFGRHIENDMERIILADEISPDNCRLWDMKTNERMDKDRFRKDLGQVEEGYQEVARRLGVLQSIEEEE
jgi:phosphoribosylaminoimidazole-succinocarboxamide synthase